MGLCKLVFNRKFISSFHCSVLSINELRKLIHKHLDDLSVEKGYINLNAVFYLIVKVH